MRLACDVGGTFTDLVLEDDTGRLRLFKSPTTPADPLVGLLAAVDPAALDSLDDQWWRVGSVQAGDALVVLR